MKDILIKQYVVKALIDEWTDTNKNPHMTWELLPEPDKMMFIVDTMINRVSDIVIASTQSTPTLDDVLDVVEHSINMTRQVLSIPKIDSDENAIVNYLSAELHVAIDKLFNPN